jgi:hypothetical protein
MTCLLIILALGVPRIALFAIALTTNWIDQAYETNVWPFLGWLFMPYTTLAYLASRLHHPEQITPGYLILIIVAVMMDLGSNGSATRSKNNSCNS